MYPEFISILKNGDTVIQWGKLQRDSFPEEGFRLLAMDM